MEISDDQSWTVTAPSAAEFRVEIAFSLLPDFPTDTSSPSARDWPTKPLRLPDIPRAERLFVSSREVEGRESELAAYYRDAAAAMKPYGAAAETLYWLRLRLTGGRPGTTIGFSWWDTLGEMKPFLHWIETAADGDVFDDLDQGWRVQAVRRGDELFFRHSGFDQGGEYGKMRAPRQTCIAQARDALARTEHVVAALRRELGINPWA